MTIKSFTNILTLSNDSSPMYQKIKEHILEKIAEGEWLPNQKLPSENEISAILNISRMTVNRAFKELTEEGYLFREKGAGTFVAMPFQLTPFFELMPISQEVALEGRKFSSQIIQLIALKKQEKLVDLGIQNWVNEKILYSEILYFNESYPIQYEKRYVLASFAPNYLKESFMKDCSTTYLQTLSSILTQKHTLEAMIPDQNLSDILQMNPSEACFKVQERLQIRGNIVSYAEQYYPASRYRFHSKV